MAGDEEKEASRARRVCEIQIFNREETDGSSQEQED